MKKGEEVLMSEQRGRERGPRLAGIGRRGVERRTAHYQGDHQKGHQAPLGVMHVIPVPHPRLRLRAHRALRAAPRPVPRRREPGPEVVDEVFDDEARLGQHQRRRARGGRDGHEGRFAEGVHVLQLGGRELVVPFVGFEGVG